MNLVYKNYLVEALTRSGKIAEALSLSRAISERHPRDANNWFDFGVLAVIQKKENLALERFQKAISLGINEKAIFEDEPLILEFRKSKAFKLLEKHLK